MADGRSGARTTRVAEPRSWPEIPVGYFMAACAGLIGIFCGGLAIASGRTKEERIAEMKFEALQQVYRKTA
jgi:hypothetical protein